MEGTIRGLEGRKTGLQESRVVERASDHGRTPAQEVGPVGRRSRLGKRRGTSREQTRRRKGSMLLGLRPTEQSMTYLMAYWSTSYVPTRDRSTKKYDDTAVSAMQAAQPARMRKPRSVTKLWREITTGFTGQLRMPSHVAPVALD